ncbi:MAG TPA: transglutaminase domain-containing protein [Kofleriaceae bacterium]
MRFAVVIPALAACARPPALPADVPGELPANQTRHYTIWLGGARVGTAVESEAWAKDGVRLRRDERMRFLRGDTEVELATAIVVDASPTLEARRVRWTERSGSEVGALGPLTAASGGDVRGAEAARTRDAWQLSTGGTLVLQAVPAELVPLLVRRDGAFAGTVFLPARGFVAGTGRIDPVAPGRLVARLALDGGPVVEATIDLDADGTPTRVVDGEGVIAIRTTAEQASEPFPAVDLIAATAIPIAGTRRAQGTARTRLVLDGNLALPGVPGQLAHPAASGVAVELDAALAGSLPAGAHHVDRSGDIRELVTAVRARITPDLGASPASARSAATATAGDCTTFALAYAALAERRAIPTRVVTGLRVELGDRNQAGSPGVGSGRLIRHRWAVSWTGTRWIAIDAAFGAVPAGGNLIGLAVHDADDAGLVAGEAALTQVRAASWAE